MKPNALKVNTAITSCGIEYRVIDKDGTIYVTTYDAAAAGICCDALNQRYLAG
jgi:hypothetical protein